MTLFSSLCHLFCHLSIFTLETEDEVIFTLQRWFAQALLSPVSKRMMQVLQLL